ncbi:hypothetical protein [Deinococcus sp.]|uniref:hypothetical protein n=1 Tax=Deinococcus sp. TaxID=47478 RepID=UPI003C7D3F98
MTSPSDRPGIPPETDGPSVPDPRPISTPQPMPEEAPGYDAPTPIVDPPSNPDMPGSTPTNPGISDPLPATI